MKNLAFLLLGVFTLAVAQIPSPTPEVSPSEFCEECSLHRWNQKQLYAPTDVDCPMFFYQCVKLHDGTWLRYRHDCAGDTYFREDILQCVPKYKGGCDDPCANKAVQIAGKHPGDDQSPADNCASYWVCSNYISYHQCCPEWMEFDPVSLECVLSTTCGKQQWLDCVGEWSETEYTNPPVEHHDDGTCWIQWNGHYVNVQGVNGATTYDQLDYDEELEEYVVVATHKCAPGTAYNAQTCYCSDEIPATMQPPCPIILNVYFGSLNSFDEIHDVSLYNYHVHCSDHTAIALSGGDFNGNQFCSVPGMMTHDLVEGFWFVIVFTYREQGGPLLNNRGDPTVDLSVRPWADWSIIVDVFDGDLFVRVRNTHMDVATVQLSVLPDLHTYVSIHYCLGKLEVLLEQDGFDLVSGSDEISEANFAWMHHCPWVFGHDTQGDRFFDGTIEYILLQQGCHCGEE